MSSGSAGISVHTLPFLPGIPMENLKALEVAANQLRILWERDFKVPRELRELSICAPLSGFPQSIVQLKHFEKITICHALFKTLPEEICDVHSLKYLVLRNCSEMISLPDSMEKLSNLLVIDLTNASSLQMLPNSFGNLIGLEYLYLRGCPNLTISNETFGKITTLQYLDLQGCSNVKELPPQVAHQQSLVRLDVSASMLKELPANGIRDLSKMEVLELGGDCLLESPPLLLVLKSLKELFLFDCPELKCLPNSLELLTQLREFNIENFPELRAQSHLHKWLRWCNCTNFKSKSIVQLKQFVKIVICRTLLKTLPEELCNVRSLNYLELKNCSNLIKLLDSLRKTTNLQAIDLTDASSLQMLLIGPEHPNLRGCPSLSISNKTFRNITTLDLQGCSNVMELLPHLRSLVRLDVSAGILQELSPDVIGDLSKVTEMELGGDRLLEMLSLLFVLKSLKELCIFDCPKLKCLPYSFGLLSQLTDLRIENCPELKCLPDSFGQLIQLRILKIGNCPVLKSLPDSFEQLTQLRELKIEKCGIEYLPRDLKMNNLKYLAVMACPLRELPFRRVEGEIERELNTVDKCMFHGGVCPNLQCVFPNLQFLSFNNCKELRQIGRLCGLPKLEILCFGECENIEELSSVDTLISLKVLHVNGCAKLEKIEGLGQFTELPGVERSRSLTISVTNCPKLQLPQPRCHDVHPRICNY